MKKFLVVVFLCVNLLYYNSTYFAIRGFNELNKKTKISLLIFNNFFSIA